MPAQSTADVVALQLEAVRDKLPALFHYNDVFVSRIDARKDVVMDVSSRAARIPLQVRPGSRAGSVNLGGGALGRGTATHYDVATLTALPTRLAVEINEDALMQTSGEPKSIRKLLSLEIANAVREMRVQLNAWLQTAGNGVLATVSGTGSGTITVANPPFYAQLLRPGQIVQVYDSTITTNRGSVLIASIDYPNAVLNLDASTPVPSGTVSGDVLLPEGLSGAQPIWYFGIPYHHSDATTGTWLNLSRSSVPEIRANSVDAGQNALTTSVIRLALNKIIQRVGRVNPKQLVAHLHPAQAAAYEELAVLVTEIHKGTGNENFDMLFGTGRLAGVESFVDIHADRTRIDFVNFDTWGKIESAPLDFLKRPDGSYFERPYDTAGSGSPVAAILFYLIWFGQFFIDNPAAVAYIKNLAIPSGYTTGL
jgi:hypothetical protein